MRPNVNPLSIRTRMFRARGVALAVAGATLFAAVGCSSSAMNRDTTRADPLSADRDLTSRPMLATTMPTPARVSSNKPVSSASVKSPLFASISPPVGQTIRGSLAYPTGDPKTSAIVLEKAVPAEVVSGKPYFYELTVRNVSATRLENVDIVETLPAGLKLDERLSGATLTVADDRAHLKVGGLNAGESRTLKVGATATQGGAVTSCATVTFDSSLVLGVNVVTPSLTMTKTLPADVLMCESVPFKVSLTNSGTGTARNVKLQDTLPEGIVTADGKPAIFLTLGDLVAGETKNVELGLKLLKAGTFSDTAIATADDGLRAEATATMNAHQAILELEKAGPRQQYVGVAYSYDIKLTNRGDADATNVSVVDTLPPGLVGVEASDGGTIRDGKVTWNLPTLRQATVRQLTLTVRGVEPGTAHNSVVAKADCAIDALVSADTSLVGVAAVRLDVLDQPGPIVVGSNTTYTILVSNAGSAPATNVKLIGELEPQMEYVASDGTTPGVLSGNAINFTPLATLAPGAKVTYTVTVKAKDAGDVRFKATLTSDQLGRPIDELESTTFYK